MFNRGQAKVQSADERLLCCHHRGMAPRSPRKRGARGAASCPFIQLHSQQRLLIPLCPAPSSEHPLHLAHTSPGVLTTGYQKQPFTIHLDQCPCVSRLRPFGQREPTPWGDECRGPDLGEGGPQPPQCSALRQYWVLGPPAHLPALAIAVLYHRTCWTETRSRCSWTDKPSLNKGTMRSPA